MVYRYPQEVHDFVKEWSPKLRDADLAESCNKELGTSFTAQSMKAFRGNHGYRNGKKQWTSEEYWKYQKRYPPGMYEFVRDNSWGVSSREMAEMVNKKYGTNFSASMMKQFRRRHGIKSGVTGWYQKGHPPGTKGKTIEEICKNDPEKLTRVRAAYFKKGHKPWNKLPVGSIVVNVDGYKLRKKQEEGKLWDRWEFLHRAVWEEHNGPIPPGMIVTFRNGDKLNCDISNLMLISKGENATLARLGLRSEDPDLMEAGLGVVRLKQAMTKAKKKKRKKRGGKQTMSSTRAEQIGNRLRELRGERSQKEVAEAVNVSVMAISKYENGMIVPSDNVKIALAEFFGTTVDALFFAP